MKDEPVGTKLALIEAAGELFAENGPDGVSVRTIAEKAGANIAAINYHFGSKENLYAEALRYVLVRNSHTPVSALLENKERLRSRDGIAEVVRQIVRERFGDYFSPDTPKWHGQLIIRSLTTPSAALSEIVQQNFQPDHEAMIELAQRANPRLSRQEAELWAFSLNGQTAFYVFAEVPILLLHGKDHYDRAFLDAAAEFIARTAIAALFLAHSEG